MPSHSDPAIRGELGVSLEEQMSALEQRLIEDLHTNFKEVLGIPIPRADQAELLKLDTAMKYDSKISFNEFMNGAKRLVKGVFQAEHNDVITKSIAVAESAMNNIISDGTQVQTGFQGDSAKIESKDKVYIAACYTSTAFCSQSDWGTQRDFYVAKFVFTVFSTRGSVNTLLRIRAI